jgi:uncharacterized iron-regulated membrane protein
MRRFHRIISLIAGIFLALITITGVLLHIREFLEEGEKERSKTTYNLTQGIPADWTVALNRGLVAVYARNADVQIERIRIDVDGSKPRLLVQTGGEDRMNYIIGIDGAILKATRPEKNLLLRLHTGEIIGDAGEVLNLLFGLGLMGLLGTGFVMLWNIFRAAPDTRTAIRRIFGIKP